MNEALEHELPNRLAFRVLLDVAGGNQTERREEIGLRDNAAPVALHGAGRFGALCPHPLELGPRTELHDEHHRDREDHGAPNVLFNGARHA